MTFRADFEVHGLPKGQPRPQAFSMKQKDGTSIARLKMRGTAEAWKGDIVLAGKDWRPASPIQGPVDVQLEFWMPRPKRLMRIKDTELAIFHEAKPDLDNLIKAVLDVLTSDGLWLDDSQVSRLQAVKMYHAKGGSPGAQIRIEELTQITTN